jgi:hypothetical protein
MSKHNDEIHSSAAAQEKKKKKRHKIFIGKIQSISTCQPPCHDPAPNFGWRLLSALLDAASSESVLGPRFDLRLPINF